jgi:lauroyl/myristoyl acyltransferase
MIGSNKSNIQFIAGFFTQKATDQVVSHIICKYPDCFSKYIDIKGDAFVKELQLRNSGVLVIGNHGGPVMLQTYLFSEIFSIPLSSYSAPWIKNHKNTKSERDQLLHRFPLYYKGEEKKLLNALLSGEWVNMLLDVNFNGHQTPNCIFAKHHIELSQFPFRIALKYNIPILYIEVKRIKSGSKIQINIKPIDNFTHPDEGLKQYVQNLESTIFTDNYSNTNMHIVLRNVQQIL